MATTFIGKVEYVYKSELLTWIKSLNIHTAQDLGDAIVPSMFKKRRAFSHKSEVRVIVYQKDNGDMLEYDILDIQSFFDEFVIDPRLDNKSANKITQQLLKLVEDPKKVKQSILYNQAVEICKKKIFGVIPKKRD